MADLIGADPKEIIFTSGATESNNLAIKGVANFYRDKKKHIITTQTDRKSFSWISLAAFSMTFEPHQNPLLSFDWSKSIMMSMVR